MREGDTENRGREAVKFVGQFGEMGRHSWNGNDCSFHCSDLLFSLFFHGLLGRYYLQCHTSNGSEFQQCRSINLYPLKLLILCKALDCVRSYEFKHSKVTLLLFSELAFLIFARIWESRGEEGICMQINYGNVFEHVMH